MGSLYKDVEPFIGLIFTTIFLWFCHSRYLGRGSVAIQEKKEEVERKVKVIGAFSIGAVIAFVFVGAVLIFTKFPKFLEETHPAIVEQKAYARQQCEHHMKDFNMLEAELHIRNNTLSRKLAHEFQSKQRKSIDRVLRPVTNEIFFRTGAFCSVLPIFLVLVVDFILYRLETTRLKSVEDKFPSLADWKFVLLPSLNAACAYTWIANLGFHFWLRERQVTGCMLLSGHWYTALHTVFCFVGISLFLRSECQSLVAEPVGERNWTKTGSVLPYAFISWFILYMALVSRTLSSSQLFHHDWEESVQGIKSMLMVLPFAALASSFVLTQSLHYAQILAPEGESETVLASGDVCKVMLAFDREGEGELSVGLHEIVRVEDFEANGWIFVQNQTGETGFVPSNYLEKSANLTFKPRDPPQPPKPTTESSPSSEKQQVEERATKSPTAAEVRTAPSRPVPSFLSELGGNPMKNLKRVEMKKQEQKQTGSGDAPMLSQLKQRLAATRAQVEPPEPEEQNDDEWK